MSVVSCQLLVVSCQLLNFKIRHGEIMDRVTQAQIDRLLDSAETEEYTFHGKQHVVSYKFPSGFAIVGVGSCVNPACFDIELGRKYAREQVESKLWELEGYLLQNSLA